MRLRVDVSKNASTAASSQEGEFVTSTTTDAPFSASASPSPVMELTPDLGDAAIASCPCSRNLVTSFDPISPLPPITTIFMIATSFLVYLHACLASSERIWFLKVLVLRLVGSDLHAWHRYWTDNGVFGSWKLRGGTLLPD